MDWSWWNMTAGIIQCTRHFVGMRTIWRNWREPRKCCRQNPGLKECEIWSIENGNNSVALVFLMVLEHDHFRAVYLTLYHQLQIKTKFLGSSTCAPFYNTRKTNHRPGGARNSGYTNNIWFGATDPWWTFGKNCLMRNLPAEMSIVQNATREPNEVAIVKRGLIAFWLVNIPNDSIEGHPKWLPRLKRVCWLPWSHLMKFQFRNCQIPLTYFAIIS